MSSVAIGRLTLIVLCLPLSLLSCSRPTAPSGVNYDVTISGLRTEKTEQHRDYSKTTFVTYDTTAVVHLNDGKGGAPSALAHLTFVDESGLTAFGTAPQTISLVVDHGVGDLKQSTSKDVPDGQAIPPPPAYRFKFASVEPLQFARAATNDDVMRRAGEVGALAFRIRPTQIRVVADDSSYSARASIPIEALGKIPANPLRLFIKEVTTSHPSSGNVGRTEFAAVLLYNGAGSLQIDEFLNLKRTYDQKVDSPQPDPPQYSFSLVGFQELHAASVTVK